MEERTMDTPVTSVLKFARQLGIETCLEFSPGLLVPEQRIRELCSEDKCGNYGKNYMCPPHIGSLEETKARLQKFQHGVLLQYSRSLDVRNDNEGLKQSKLDFHNKILQLEEFLRNEGVNDVWGMIGGSCELCEPCKAEVGEPCPYPNKARTSLTSLAIDILPFLDKFRLDNKFHPDKITWTGCILF
jgi:predicted metal-binding protein